jgi:hypothetical protein
MLFASAEDIYLTRVRSGRDGITYDAGRHDLVQAGTAAPSRLARPRLRELGLAEWADLFVGQSGQSVERSPAGRRGELLGQLWDSREEFVSSMTGPLLPVLRAFQPSHPETSKAYPDGEGVVLLTGAREGYLNYAGMAKLAGPGIHPSALRQQVDILTARTVLRRGLVLDCAVCDRVSFIPIGDLAQVNRCPRCGTANELAQQRWRDPRDEPSWFYDLHPVARDLLKEHGEAPLQLSRHLRSIAARYSDAPELELRDASGNPVAEADLIALSDDQLITAEAKSNDVLGSNPKEIRRAAAKRVLLAATLHADQIILATTQPGWSAASVAAIGEAVAGHRWLAGLRPAVRLIADLGSDQVQDQRLDLASGKMTQWR